jgi:hypothetical protein
MSKKKHIYPNGTKVEIHWEGSCVGSGVITNHNIEPEDDTEHLYYEVKIKRTDLEIMLGLEEKHWLNAYEVKPIRCSIIQRMEK